MHQAASGNEPVCLWCLKSLDENPSFEHILYGHSLLCSSCQQRIKTQGKWQKFGKNRALVLYEYNEEFEQLWQQYAFMKDTELARLFFNPFENLIGYLKRRNIQIVAQNAQIARILKVWDIDCIVYGQGKGNVFIGLSPKSLLHLNKNHRFKKIILLASKPEQRWKKWLLKWKQHKNQMKCLKERKM